MIWFIQDPARYQMEIEAVDELQSKATWLTGVTWHIGPKGRLLCDADIQVGDCFFPVTLCYNEAFPHTPPSVLPRVNERWSEHQYGQGGELCLEYGPDNWVPNLTGADMLTSAFKLLASGMPDETGMPQIQLVASRHEMTLGQGLRSQKFRFFYTSDLQERLSILTEVTSARFRVRIRNTQWIGYVLSLQRANGEAWPDPQVPKSLSESGLEIPGFIIPRPDGFAAENIESALMLRELALGQGIVGSEALPESEVLLVVTSNGMRAFYLWHKGDVAFEFSIVPPDPAPRIYSEYALLAEKKVGLIGCGSVGSKLAAMLIRAGVGKLVLIDDDVLRPENLVRNELDWSGVGEHKADALSRRLHLLRADLEIDVRRQRIGGQEAGITLHSTMTALSECDVIVDATAEGQAFNLAAAAATQNRLPMLWAEVYAGGIAGLIARSRPGLEPSPHLARARILHWCAQQNAPFPVASGANYEGGDENSPQIADDADVSVIAAHLARLAIDTLIARNPSYFEYSAYVIGLREGWFITQAFDTAPIDLGAPDDPGQATQQDVAKMQAGIEGILKLIENTNAPSSDPS